MIKTEHNAYSGNILPRKRYHRPLFTHLAHYCEKRNPFSDCWPSLIVLHFNYHDSMILQHIMRRWNDIIDRLLISESRSLYLVPENWWKNQVHCQYTKIKIIISLFLKFLESYQWSIFNFFYRRFEFESQNSGGACVDYVNFYDGTYTSGSLINTNRYCGSTTPTNITSTGTTLTVEMITDNSAIYRGFDLLLSAYSDGMDVIF